MSIIENYQKQYEKARSKGDPALADVLAKVDLSGSSVANLSRRSGVSASTIRNWQNKKTRNPQNITMEFVLRAAGFRRQIVPIGKGGA